MELLVGNTAFESLINGFQPYVTIPPAFSDVTISSLSRKYFLYQGKLVIKP